jgi:uncharacterized membrane protein (DUF106 family)
MNKGMIIFFIVFIISAYVASSWDKIPVVKNTVSSVLDPTFGALLKWNLYIGFLFIIALTSLILTLAQKYLSDQQALKELKKEQKILNEEMKKYKEHPEKLMELQKKQLEFLPKTFDLTMKPLMFTSIPIVLFFRWFGAYLNPVFGGWWIFYYIVGSIIFSTLFRKWFDVA